LVTPTRSNYGDDDWRGHNLSAAACGSHRFQSGSDCVLVAIATRVVLLLLLNN
jgi:Ni/Co efflux regulator RcnB